MTTDKEFKHYLLGLLSQSVDSWGFYNRIAQLTQDFQR